jgi:glutathione S-transferase
LVQLFYSPGACSLVTHIALEEAGADYEAVSLALAKGEQHDPEYLKINPHARVPALATDQGVITENVAILNYLADRFGAEGAVPTGDPFERARANQLLGWFASSVHIGFASIFRPGRFSADDAVHDAIVAGGRAAVSSYFTELDDLCGSNWLAGDTFTGADSYVATFFRWGRRIQLDMTAYPRMADLVQRVIARPGVERALGAEGLTREEFAEQ